MKIKEVNSLINSRQIKKNYKNMKYHLVDKLNMLKKQNKLRNNLLIILIIKVKS